MQPSRFALSAAFAALAGFGVPTAGLAQATGQTPAASGQTGAAATGQKEWKDRAEYDLYDSITKETAPAKKLELLNQWKDKYPTTAFIKERQTLFLTTYVALGQGQNAVNAAKDSLAQDPKDFTSLYYITLYTPTLGADPATLDQGDKAAHGLLENLDTQFAADKKPASVGAADWTKARNDTEAIGHTNLGWIAMQRKDNEAAEKEFQASLAKNPNNGQVSYWLGAVILGQKKPERQSEALYDFARAAAYQGPGALPDANRATTAKYFEDSYVKFHGGKDGMQDVLAKAKTNALPPADFKIPNIVDKERNKIAQDEAAAKANPSLALWKNIKTALTGDQGAAYFGSNMKGAALPAFTGKVVESKAGSKTVTVAIEDGATPDATLVLDGPVVGNVAPGTPVTFTGIAESYTKEPFMVTFNVEKGKISGITTGAAGPAHRAPVRRRR